MPKTIRLKNNKRRTAQVVERQDQFATLMAVADLVGVKRTAYRQIPAKLEAWLDQRAADATLLRGVRDLEDVISRLQAENLQLRDQIAKLEW